MKNKKLFLAFISIFIFIIVVVLWKDSLLGIWYPKNYQEIVLAYTDVYDVEENLVFAVIKAESNFKEDATSSRNAIGLMQLMEDTAKDVVQKNQMDIDIDNMKQELYDPRKNIEIGTCYLSTLLQRYQNKEVALAAYNAGIGTVDNWIQKGMIQKDGSDIENIPYKETNHYVRKILRDYKIYEDLDKN